MNIVSRGITVNASYVVSSVAKGPKKIVWGRENRPNVWQVYRKKGPNFSVAWF
jgi:hypothetical protein